MRVLSLSGKPSAARSGPAISTLIHKVSGLRRHRSGHFLRKAAMTNARPLGGMGRCISQYLFAVVMRTLAGSTSRSSSTPCSAGSLDAPSHPI